MVCLRHVTLCIWVTLTSYILTSNTHGFQFLYILVNTWSLAVTVPMSEESTHPFFMSPVTSDAEHFTSSWRNVCGNPLPIFELGCFYFLRSIYSGVFLVINFKLLLKQYLSWWSRVSHMLLTLVPYYLWLIAPCPLFTASYSGMSPESWQSSPILQ